jgi:hypothetical protein
MNGEPRAEAPGISSTGTRNYTSDADLPLPPVVSTDRVTRRTVTQDQTVAQDQPLAPLFSDGATSDFRARWDLVQRSFVDDPRAAVTAADGLVGEVTKALTDTFSEQRSNLDKNFDQADAPTTESLRIALRQYRSFFERLLSI